MSARAIYRATLHLGEERVPMKLYAAAADRTVHFRLLHAKDRAPVRQALVHPATGAEVPYDETRRAFVTEEGDVVLFDQDELAALEPESSREIRPLRAVPRGTLDRRLYDRPYHLGPDDREDAFAALSEALDEAGLELIVRWTMRRKEHVGALGTHEGRPMLVTLRHEGEVVDLSGLRAPAGAALDEREKAMARRLVDMLAEPFDPAAYRDEHRERVLELVEAKRAGTPIEMPRPRRRRRPTELARALEASLREARRGA